MKILVMGSGGREHALTWKLRQSPRVSEIFCAPGNGGTAGIATNVPIPVEHIETLKDWAIEHKIDYTIVGPEKPLDLGIVDLFEASGLKIFGVNQKAAKLESSKVFAKQLMQKNDIPTASCEIFDNLEDARAFVEKTTFPTVIKADGLAAGKGVLICKNRDEALQALNDCFVQKVFGDSGSHVIVETFLTGEEVSYICFVDGESYIPMVPSQDHKKIFDGDKGPNTGGMGAYTPVPWFDKGWEKQVHRRVIEPLLSGLKKEGIEFRGILYIGLLIHEKTPYVLEYNVRFGDPEAQAILMRLKSDLLPLLEATSEGTLNKMDPKSIEWDPRPAVCVVMTSEGYPGGYQKGHAISGWNDVDAQDRVLFHAGTTLTKTPLGRKELKTSGGRVLNVVALGNDYRDAMNRAYQGVSKVSWPGAYHRRDIGERVCQREK